MSASTPAPDPDGENLIRLPATEPAAQLLGMRLGDGWHVVEMLERDSHASGSQFSFGYRVVHTSGREAFLKALDYSRAIGSPDGFAETIDRMVDGYLFERDLHARCSDAGMNRVVRALDFGEITVPGAQLPVNYLIFELADGDVRAQFDSSTDFDLPWRLRSLHHIAVGMRQLHTQGISHQDLKPSNILIFLNRISKLADLGSAADSERSAPLFEDSAPGDPDYAPPECLYGFDLPDRHGRHISRDLYLLGSMMLYYVIELDTTSAVAVRLQPSMQPSRWDGNFEEILPELRDAFDDVAVELHQSLEGRLADEFVQRFRELCDPDPRLRGHPAACRGGDRYSLERYVSRFDVFASNAEGGLLRVRAG